MAFLLSLRRLAACAAALWTFAASAQTELLFYTTVPRNLSEPMAKRFSELNPGIKVNGFQAGVETLLEKLQLEIRGTGRIQADVVWIQEPSAMKQFADAGRFEPYQPKELEQILPVYRDPQGRFVANQVGHVFLMYNTAKLSKEQAPKSWKDLTDRRFANRLILANPRISGTGAMIAAAMVQTYGWSYWESVAKLKPILVSGSQGGIPSTIIQGERLVAPIHDYTITELMKKGQPVGYVVPAEGGLAQPAYFAITKGTAKADAARKFYDFMISKEAAQTLLSMNMFHTRVDMPGPEGWPRIGEIKTLKFDWAAHERSKAQMKEKFADLMER